MTTVRANGVGLRVDRFCVGPDHGRPTVVFIHGLGVADRSFIALAIGMPLATGAVTIHYDLRGHGRSDAPPTGYRAADHADDLVALLDAMGIDEPVHLVGGSYGGAVATWAALRRPERVASVFLLDGILPIAGWTDHILPWLETAEDTLAGGGYDIEDVAAMAGGMSVRKAASMARRIERLLFSTSLLDDVRREPALGGAQLAELTCPVFALYGSRSELLYQGDALVELVPHARTHVIAEADHRAVFGHTRQAVALMRREFGLPPRSGDRELVTATAGEG
jgi:pimeloyl-ACP methyl ester carboxylesterase